MRTLTPQQYLDLPKRRQPWAYYFHILEVVKHCLKGDPSQTLYKDQRPARQHFEDFREAMEERQKEDNFQEILQNNYRPLRRFKEVASDQGELDIGACIRKRINPNSEEQIFKEEIQVVKRQPALTILLDAAINFAGRESSEMTARHKEVYSLTVHCMSVGRPVRVIACKVQRFTERRQKVAFFFILKDYSDPIFPGIWGALQSNRTANDFANTFMDYFVGTRHRGNGYPVDWNVSEYFDLHNTTVIMPKLIRKQ